MSDGARLPPDQVLVGGTGRSGTTILGRLIGMHSRYHVVPVEARFHVDLTRVLHGQADLHAYAERFREDTVDRRLGRLADPEDLLAALDVLLVTLPSDGVRAAQRFVRAVLDPMALRARKPGWVEMTPANILVASRLLPVVPDAVFVHIYRDGRDVASSTAKTWGTMDAPQALEWWAGRMRGIKKQVGLLPPERLHTLRMEALVTTDRQPTLHRLLGFLGVEPEEQLQSGFDAEFGGSRANVGRWRAGLSVKEQDATTGRYRELLAELGEDGPSGLSDLAATVDEG